MTKRISPISYENGHEDGYTKGREAGLNEAADELLQVKGERDRYREALETVDRRFRDIAAQSGGPLWVEAKRILRGNHELIHDDVFAALHPATEPDRSCASALEIRTTATAVNFGPISHYGGIDNDV